MANLIYSGIMSLDGYTVDESGSFDWAAPDADVHQFINDLERPLGTYLYGRRMYETMVFWETADVPALTHRVEADYTQIWRAADKVVYSSTLSAVSSARTRLERTFDAEAVRALKAEADSDIGIGGPTLAASAISAGLVDEFQLFVMPVVVGGGTPYLPPDVHIDLELVDERRFASGVAYLHYRTRSKNP